MQIKPAVICQSTPIRRGAELSGFLFTGQQHTALRTENSQAPQIVFASKAALQCIQQPNLKLLEN